MFLQIGLCSQFDIDFVFEYYGSYGIKAIIRCIE